MGGKTGWERLEARAGGRRDVFAPVDSGRRRNAVKPQNRGQTPKPRPVRTGGARVGGSNPPPPSGLWTTRYVAVWFYEGELRAAGEV